MPEPLPIVETARLQLRPFAPAELLAMRESTAAFERASGLLADAALRAFLVGGDVSPAWIEKLRSLSQPDPWILGFAVIERASNIVIGTAAFKAPPDRDGLVEIAYGVVPSRERQGFATEAAQALVEFAARDDRVRTVCAHTLAERNASTSVLAKCGFTFSGAVDDPDDGAVWRWTRPARILERAAHPRRQEESP